MNKVTCAVAAALALTGCVAVGEHKQERIAAHAYKSNFPLSRDSYNAISVGSDGRVYYVLSTESVDEGAAMFRFDPSTRKITRLGDLTRASGEESLRAIPQGKSHVSFREANGHEGIITMNMDQARGRLYGITWPTGYFLRYDLAKKDLKNLGSIAIQGENGKGPTYETICRSLAIDPRDGSVYFTNSPGSIFRYRYDSDSISQVSGDNMVKDYFGSYDPHSPGHMGHNWRQTTWYDAGHSIYGVHGNSGYLFRFDPATERLDVLDRITSEPSRRSGMFDEFSYGYLGFALGPDGHTLHYLTGGPVYEHGRRVAGISNTAKGESKGVEDLHLVTYDIENSRYADNGAIFLENGDRPAYVNSVAVGKDGTVYTLSRITEQGATRADLISFPGPLRK